MVRVFLIVGLLSGGDAALAQFDFTDACATSEWLTTCNVPNFCGPGQGGCLNNWASGAGCGTQCPLPFPSLDDDVTFSPGGIATLSAGAGSARNLDVQRPFMLGNTLNLREDAVFRAGLTWLGGTIQGIGAGTVTLPATSGLVLDSANAKGVSSRDLVLDEAAVWQGAGGISLTNGARIVNNAVFLASNDAAITYFGGTQVSFENLGLFRKNNSNGVTSFAGTAFNNHGDVEIATGTLRMGNTGTSSGPFTIFAGAVLDFAGGSYNFAAGTSTSGFGLTRINGTLNLLGDVEMHVTELTHTLRGPGELFITDELAWISGTMQNGGVTIAPSGATITLTTGNAKSLADRTIDNRGLLSWQDSGGISVTNGSVIENSGAFEARNDAAITFFGGTPCAFNNSGSFRKLASAGTTTIAGLPFNNTGQVQVESGTLRMSNNGTSSGPFSLDAGTVLEFAGGAYNFAAGTSVTGEGLARVNGTLNLVDDISIDRTEITHTLRGPGDLTVGDSLVWISGVMQNGGTTIVPANATLTLSSVNTKSLELRSIANEGLLIWQDAGGISMTSGSEIRNAGLFEARNDAAITFFGGASCAFINSGTFRKWMGAGVTAIAGLPFNNTGQVQVQSGTLRMSNTGTSSGPFSLDAGTVLEFAGGAYNFAAGTSVTGEGLARVNGTLNLIDDVSIDHTELTQTLRGPGDLTVAGSLAWTSGTMQSGGATRIPAGSTMTMSSINTKSLDNRVIRNDGLVVWEDSGAISVTNGSTVENAGTFEARNNANFTFFGGAFCSFDNTGTFRKLAGDGVTTFAGAAFNNHGVAAVETGTLRMGNGGVCTGTFSLAAGAVLDTLGGSYTFAAGSSATGDGLMRINGSVNLTGSAVFENSELTNTLNGPGDLTATRSMAWTGGTMQNGGTTTIAAGAAMTLAGGNVKSLSSRTIANQGLLVWQDSGAVNLTNGAAVNNSGTFEARGDASMTYFGGAPCAFNNFGLFRKATAAGVTAIAGLPFNNAGSVDVQIGTLNASNYSQTGGSTRIAASAVLQSGQPLAIQGGSLTGRGSVVGNVANSGGRMQPGESVGALAINGNYTQGPAAALDIELGGTTPVSGYDQLTVSGAATLAGELNLSLANGFAPAIGDQFVVLTAGSISGAFATVTGPVAFNVSYTTTSVIVTVAPPPCAGDLNGDGSVGLSDLSVLLAHFGTPGGSTFSDGDLDGDQDVDLADLTALLSQFGVICD